jgi:hypothetical protein
MIQPFPDETDSIVSVLCSFTIRCILGWLKSGNKHDCPGTGLTHVEQMPTKWRIHNSNTQQQQGRTLAQMEMAITGGGNSTARQREFS